MWGAIAGLLAGSSRVLEAAVVVLHLGLTFPREFTLQHAPCQSLVSNPAQPRFSTILRDYRR